MTSHAAVVARGMGTCCVSGCGDIVMDEENKKFTLAGKEYHEGDEISIDGTTGNIYSGIIPTVDATIAGEFGRIMGWVLTYLLSEGSPAGPYVLSDEDRRMFMRIVHCQNRRYHVMLGDRFDRCVMHPFENIYEGISVEGCPIPSLPRHRRPCCQG